MLNLLGAALQALAGTPVLPAGSTVTVKVSSLTMPVTGQTVTADWYFPADPTSSKGVIYLQHGLAARNGAMYSYTARQPRRSKPTASWWRRPCHRTCLPSPTASGWAEEPCTSRQSRACSPATADALTASASAAAGSSPAPCPTGVVLVGHSARRWTW